MTKNHALLFCVLFTTFGQSANATTCTSLGVNILTGTFTATHSMQCAKKALTSVSFQKTTTPSDLSTLFGDESVTISDAYLVINPQFSGSFGSPEVQALKRFDRAAVITLSRSANLCFLLWYSSDYGLTDLNVILGKDAIGNVSLGSNNKRETSEVMLLTRTSSTR